MPAPKQAPAQPVAARNVYQRLNHAKKIVAETTFKKVAGEGLKYAYLPIDQVKPVVEAAMNEAGLVLLRGPLETYDIRESWVSQGQYGGSTTWFHLGGRQLFTWVNIDNPEDRIEQEYSGEAKDNSDKTYSKLYTAIYKNFVKAEFNISDSPKDDTDNTEDEVRAEKAEGAAIAAANRKRAMDAAKNDPFFKKGAAQDKAAADAHRAAVSDRPREVMVATIMKANRQMATRRIVTKYSDKAGVDPNIWTDEMVADCYAEVCDTMREVE